MKQPAKQSARRTIPPESQLSPTITVAFHPRDSRLRGERGTGKLSIINDTATRDDFEIHSFLHSPQQAVVFYQA